VSGQPGYPVSGQPAGYPPGYQQQPPPAFPPAAGYPQGQPQPVYGGPVYTPTPQPQKKGNGLKITLGVIGGVLLICAIVACVFLYPVFSESGAHVTAPPTLPGGLTKDTSDASTKLADSAESSLRSDVNSLDEVATGVYTASDNPQNVVILVAATGTFLSPGSEVDSAFKGFDSTSGSLTLSTPTTYDAGKLGGTVKCSSGSGAAGTDTTVSMCVWADHGSIGMVMFMGQDLAAVTGNLIPIREAVQTR
jgi:hypothetical protein